MLMTVIIKNINNYKKIFIKKFLNYLTLGIIKDMNLLIILKILSPLFQF